MEEQAGDFRKPSLWLRVRGVQTMLTVLKENQGNRETHKPQPPGIPPNGFWLVGLLDFSLMTDFSSLSGFSCF